MEVVRDEVAKVAGPEIEVRALQQRTLVEIRNLDQWTSSDEVLQAVSSSVGVEQDIVKVVSLRKRFGGTQLALVSLPAGEASRLINRGRLRVGMVCGRVRTAAAKVRCFRCLAYGHTRKACQGPDRSESCRLCGELGHKVITCKASAQDVDAFAKILGAEQASTKPS